MSTVRAKSGGLWGRYGKPTKISFGHQTQEYLLQNQIAPFLRAMGYQYGNEQINKLCAPAAGQGPPVALWLGRRPLRTTEAVLAWAEARLRKKIDKAFRRDCHAVSRSIESRADVLAPRDGHVTASVVAIEQWVEAGSCLTDSEAA